MKFLTTFLLAVSFSSVWSNTPPTLITGPSPVPVNSTAEYVYEGLEAHPYGAWIISDGGTILSQTIVGTTHTVTVQWNEAGSQTIGFFDDGVPFINTTKIVDVEAVCPSRPATPSVSFDLSTSECSPRTITYTGTPAVGITWYWQSAAAGKSMANATSTHTVTVGGTYYVRAYNNSTQCWSEFGASIVVTIATNPSQPGSPTVSTNTCGAKTITRGTPPTGVTWYWQGTDANGTSTSNSASTFNANVSGTYAIRARNNTSLCWSSARLVTVTITPAQPVIYFEQGCGSSQILSRANPTGTDVWFWQGTNALGTSTTNFSSTYTVTSSGTYYLRARTAAGCWSPTSTAMPVIINVAPSTPNTFTISSNTCGPKTLTKPSAASGVTLYWQDVPYGTDDSSPQATSATRIVNWHGSTTIFLRAKNNTTGCWGPAISSTITVDSPSPPNNNSYTYCDWEQMIMTTTGYPVGGTMNWLDVTTSQTTITPALGVNKHAGTHVFQVKARSAQGCESTGYATVTLTVPENCDTKLNWVEKKNYSLDENKNPVLIAAARTYSDGLGNVLQTQGKDFVSGKILATQPLYDRNDQIVGNTLVAPINGTGFGYKGKFFTNTSGFRYSAADFDATSGTGSLNLPIATGQSVPGTLGWYYSANNTLEPLTPASSYPYMRTWSETGPDPKQSKTAGAGDSHRMGSENETEILREKIAVGELDHYFRIREHFVPNSDLYNGTVFSIVANTPNQYLFQAKDNAYVSTVNDMVFASTGATGVSGAYPINGTITVVPGATYTYSVRGYRNHNTNTANLYVTTSTGATIVSPGPSLPFEYANTDWVSVSFTVPEGVTAIKLGVVNATPSSTTFFMTHVKLTSSLPTTAPGYKLTMTDANNKVVVKFIDFDGKTLASATKNGLAYDDWHYIFYNKIGQQVATVPPNGVNTADLGVPQFVTRYKYDHLGRKIEVITPDAGKQEFIYNQDGNIRFSRNEAQRLANPKRFSYTNYDAIGRLIESGEYTEPATNGYVFEPHGTVSPLPNSLLNIVDNRGFTGVTRRKNITTAAQHADTMFIEYDRQALDFVTDPHHLKQIIGYGQISKTKNENSITWYSYNEFGQLAWIKQSIYGLGVKTVDYTYDFSGNLTQVAYQKGQTGDSFYHKYVYDANQRPSEAWAGRTEATLVLQAKYNYYLHGPLKRVELASDIQGIDYVYRINGTLKAINDASPSNDPGDDGTNGFAPDVFGQTLYYHDNDYAAAGHTPALQTFTGVENQYGPALKANSWHSPVDNNSQMHTYAFLYDNKYQIRQSTFGDVTAGAFVPRAAQAYSENIGEYDKNGNIKTLVRKGFNGNTIGNYQYLYEPNSNRLDKLKHNGSDLIDLTYDPLGQTTRYQEGTNVSNISYTARHYTREIRDGSNQLVLQYFYDERGNMIKRIDYTAGSPAKGTYYSYDPTGRLAAVYDQVLPAGTMTLRELPIYGATRLGYYRPADQVTLYEVKDHLTNVRAVIAQAETSVYAATMETENAANEENVLKFKNIISTNEVTVLANNTPGGNEAARLNYNRPVGPAISLKVSPGDVIDISTWAYYESGTDYDNALSAAPLISAIASSFGGVSGAAGEPGRIYTAFNNALGSGSGVFGLGGTDDEDVPGAYLAYLVFDTQKNFTGQGGYVRVTDGANMAKENVTLSDVVLDHPGYIYIFIYNRSDSEDFVFFDDLQITHNHSPIVAGGDYYPFGMAMEGREITQDDHRWGYQGEYAEKDSVTGWNRFQLRMYDPRIGRWLTPDPYKQYNSPYSGMGNMPSFNVDKNGGFTEITQLAEVVIIAHTVLEKIAIAGLSVGATAVSTLFCPDCPDPFFMEFEIGQEYIFDTDGPHKGAKYKLTSLDRSIDPRDNWSRVEPDLAEVVVVPEENLKSWAAKKLNPIVNVVSTAVVSTRNGLHYKAVGMKGYKPWHPWKLDEDGIYDNTNPDGSFRELNDPGRMKELMQDVIDVNASRIPIKWTYNPLINKTIEFGVGGAPGEVIIHTITDNAIVIHP